MEQIRKEWEDIEVEHKIIRSKQTKLDENIKVLEFAEKKLWKKEKKLNSKKSN